MPPDAFEDWISIYDETLKTIWEEERSELKKVSMIFSAFQHELEKLKTAMNSDLSQIRSELKKKERLEKCRKFKGFPKSEKFSIDIDQENESPEDEKMKEFFSIKTPLTKKDRNQLPPSPVLHKNLTTLKRKTLSSPTFCEPLEVKQSITPKNNNDSNIMESSIIEETPVRNKDKKSRKSRLELRKSKNKKKQETTLTQMFFEPKKTKKHIDSNLPSMSVTEMVDYINASSSSETDIEDDKTIDLTVPNENSPKSKAKNYIEKREPKVVYEEVVRGKERKKLKGWSCQECKDYYESLNLPPNELQKKKDLCSRHRHKFQPRQETQDGFWDLSFAPQSQDSEKSLVFNYKKT